MDFKSETETSAQAKDRGISNPPSSSEVSTISNHAETEDHSLYGAKLHILIIGLGIAVFLMALDMSILTTAIPLITERFQSTEDIGWYMSAYKLSLCALQPLSGKLYANFSLKWTFLALFLVFEIGSAISGSATSSSMLITGRAIAGVGAAGLMSGTLSIISVVVTLRLRALYTGILSSMFGIALVCGPLLGGAFTQHVSWRWVFYINLPLGIVTIGAMFFIFTPQSRAVERDTVRERVKRLDLIGVNIFIPAIFMILLALQWGVVKYAWNSGRIVGSFVGAAVILVGFALYQTRKGDMAMLPPAILTERTVLLASLSAMWGMPAAAILGLWMSEWFQSGIHLLPAMLAQTVSTIIAGGLTTMLGYYNPWLLIGTALMSIGNGLFTTFDIDSSPAVWIGYQVIYGLGAGMFITSPMIAVQSVLSPSETPMGIATVSFFQMFGGSFFAALSQTIFNKQLVKELKRNAPGIDLHALLAAGTVGLEKVVDPEQFTGVLASYNVALTDPFYLASAASAIAFLVALGLPWISIKGKNLAGGAA